MKTLASHKIPVSITLLLAIAVLTPVLGWVQPPAEETGYYYMYDDQSEPPFTTPELPPMPVFDSIWSKPGAEQLYNLGDRTHPFSLPDSFWYYGHWYVPGDELYFSPDGWVSFDPRIEVDGAPEPPLADPPIPCTDVPNSIMAPLWQNNSPTLTPNPSDSNRQWWYYDADSSTVVFQWYDIRSLANPENVYDYEVVLHLGGQEKLVFDKNSNVVFSYHFIEFLYNTSSAGWNAEGYSATGLEDESGTLGINYPVDSLADGRVIRMGFKKALDHDMTADEIIAPASLVEPNTGVDPITVIGNYGNYPDSCEAILDIYDSKDSLVYHNFITLPEGIDFGLDTVGPSIWPIWIPETPGEHYLVVLIVSLGEDQRPENDTLTKIVITTGSGSGETNPPLDFELVVDDISTIIFSLPYATKTELAVYDVTGTKMRPLIDKTYPAGTHIFYWNGCDAQGYKIAKGVYFVRMETSDWRASRRVVVY